MKYLLAGLILVGIATGSVQAAIFPSENPVPFQGVESVFPFVTFSPRGLEDAGLPEESIRSDIHNKFLLGLQQSGLQLEDEDDEAKHWLQCRVQLTRPSREGEIAILRYELVLYENRGQDEVLDTLWINARTGLIGVQYVQRVPFGDFGQRCVDLVRMQWLEGKPGHPRNFLPNSSFLSR